jgi:hypothetical protein
VSQLTKTTETKSLPIRVGSIWRASGFPGDASAVLFMREFADQRIRKIVLSEQGLEYATTGMAIKSGEFTDCRTTVSSGLRKGSVQ